jgi:hypothetical protein
MTAHQWNMLRNNEAVVAARVHRLDNMWSARGLFKEGVSRVGLDVGQDLPLQGV